MKNEKKTGALNDVRILESIDATASELEKMRDTCEKIRGMIGEGHYKVDAALNIINGLRTKEQELLAVGKDQNTIKQMSEEQIESFIQMLASPSFQSLARQFLKKWVEGNSGNNSNL